MTFHPQYLLPLVGAFIGWFTNYLAIKMLFHPRRPWHCLGLTIQGVFPQRQDEFAQRLGDLVADELVSVQEIAQRLRLKATSNELQDEVIHGLERAIAERIAAQIPLLSPIIGPKQLRKLMTPFRADIMQIVRHMASRLAADLEHEFDVKELVTRKVQALSVTRLESLVLSIMRRELRWVEIIGGILGFVIGSIQLALQSW